MSNNRKLVKTESMPVLLPVGFAGKQIFFPDNQYIRNKKLMSLNVTMGMAFSDGTQTKYTDGKNIALMDTLKGAYLTLESYSGTQFVRKKPLVEFINLITTEISQGFYYDFIGQRVNWPKSYLEFSPGFAYPVDTYILFDVQFTELTQEKIKKELGVGFNEKS